jgi:hypothetical protein
MIDTVNLPSTRSAPQVERETMIGHHLMYIRNLLIWVSGTRRATHQRWATASRHKYLQQEMTIEEEDVHSLYTSKS